MFVFNGERIGFELKDGSLRICEAVYDFETDINIKAFYNPTATTTTDIKQPQPDMNDFQYLKEFIAILNEGIFENDEDYMIIIPDNNYNSIYELLYAVLEKNQKNGLMTPTFISCKEALRKYI